MNRLGFAGLAVVAALLALPATGHAQGDVEWGIKGGLNVTGLRGANGVFDTKRGVVAGAYGVFDFAPEFGVEVDALFSMKGAKLSGTGVDVGGNPIAVREGFFVLDYIEFLESKYAARSSGEPSPFQKLAETVEDTMRAGRMSVSAIRGR